MMYKLDIIQDKMVIHSTTLKNISKLVKISNFYVYYIISEICLLNFAYYIYRITCYQNIYRYILYKYHLNQKI